MLRKFSQNEIDQLFGKCPGSLCSMGGSQYYINECAWEDRTDLKYQPRECNVHCVQASDGWILCFDEWIPDNEKDFNDGWLLAYNPLTKEGYMQEGDYEDDVLNILISDAINKDGKLGSN